MEFMAIDFVILWVDGEDPDWLAEKSKYAASDADESSGKNRYRDWGLLPYWFRSVEQFTPWVRRIHFVTWGHVPAFLNPNAPKLHIVNHSDFIPEAYLPTFSSHAIEMNIHRIPGLAEHFVYFNDDMFMLRQLSESEFFFDGLPCTSGEERPLELIGKPGIWQHAAVNDLGIVNAHFPKRGAMAKFRKKYTAPCYRWKDNLRTLVLELLFPDYFTGFRNLHAPAAYLKSTFEEIWDREPSALDATCRDRFRTAENVNQWLALWWQVAGGKFHPAVIDNLVNSITATSIDELCACIEGQRHDFICLNDPDEEINFDLLSSRLIQSFSRLFPEKSSFEV